MNTYSKTIRTLISVLALLFLLASLAQAQDKPQKIDLNGTWTSDKGESVKVVQSGQSVNATFLSGGGCPYGGARSYFFKGQLQGTSLTGSMMACASSKQMIDDCHVEPVYETKIRKTTVSADTISGELFWDWWVFDLKDGHRVNCHPDDRFSKWQAFSLKRACDKKQLCADLANAAQAAISAASEPASSYKVVKQRISNQLSQIRNELCDNKAAQRKLDDIVKALDSLSSSGPRLAQQRTLAGISNDLDSLGAASCGQVSKGKCDPGSTAKWLKKYEDAQAKLRSSSRLSDRAQKVLHERINENLKEFFLKVPIEELGKHVVVEGAAKGTELAIENEAVKKILGKLAMEISEAGAKKVVILAEVAAYLGELAKLEYKTKKDLDEAAEMSKEAEQAAAEGLALLDEIDGDIQADLANDKLCNDAREKALAANLLDAKAKHLIKEWEDENGTILDPEYHQPFTDFQAAMNRAKQILTSGPQSRAHSPSLIPVTFRKTTSSQERTMTREQVRDFLVEIHRGEGLWAKAIAILGRTLRAQESINRKLHGLLGDVSTKGLSDTPDRNRANNTATSSAASRTVTTKANTYFNQKRYAEAAKAYKEALRLNPNDAQAQNGLGSAYFKMDQYEEAIEAFKLGLRLNPNEALAHFRLGTAYAQLGRFEEAVAPLKEAIRHDPKDYIAHYNLGKLYLELGDRNSALGSYRILKAHRPDLAKMLYRSTNQ
jgi:tetratricopeptide (TPR) repeat protein